MRVNLTLDKKMKNYVIIAAYMVIGSIVSFLIYWISTTSLIYLADNSKEFDSLNILGYCIYLFMPISLFIGSTLAGYLIGKYVNKKNTYIYLSPGVYITFGVVLVNTLHASTPFAMSMLLPYILWGVISIFGTKIGIINKQKQIYI